MLHNGTKVLDSSPQKRQQGGYSPNCQQDTCQGVRFGTRTFPATLWQRFSRSTLHKVRLYQTFFTFYHTFVLLSIPQSKKLLFILFHVGEADISCRRYIVSEGYIVPKAYRVGDRMCKHDIFAALIRYINTIYARGAYDIFASRMCALVVLFYPNLLLFSRKCVIIIV